MRLEYYSSEAAAIRSCEAIAFECENDHEVTVYSGDPYYPNWVRCPYCDELMERAT